MRQKVLSSIEKIATKNKKIIFIGSDLGPNVLKNFKEKYPDIFVGIAGTVQYAHNFQTTAERDGQTMYPIFIILIFVLSYILLRSVLASVITLFVIILFPISKS